jgi:hypothetical protein
VVESIVPAAPAGLFAGIGKIPAGLHPKEKVSGTFFDATVAEFFSCA